MKLNYGKEIAKKDEEKEKDNKEARKGEFDRIDQKLKTKKLGPFAAATISAAALGFFLYCGPEGEIATLYPDGGIDAGDEEAVDGGDQTSPDEDLDATDGGAEEDGGVVDAGDEEVVDGGMDAGDEEVADGGEEADGETEDGGVVDAGDEEVADGATEDGGDQAQGDEQVCEVHTDCDTAQNGPVVLFTINAEQIVEEETVDQCVETSADCSTAISSESLVFTLSRTLTPEEQQIFQNQRVESLLGITTLYNTMQRQFGNETGYKEDLKAGETLAGIECLTINVSNGVTTMFLKYDNKLYQVKSTDPARQLGDANIYVKIYPGGNAVDGVPIVVLSDVKMAENGQTVQLNNAEYDISIEVDPQNPNNLAGMRLTRR